MECNREDFEKIVKSNVSEREWEEWRGWRPKRKWKEILSWSSGAGWGGSESERQCVLYGLLTFVHEMYAARTHT
jgi:hypothetical protein